MNTVNFYCLSSDQEKIDEVEAALDLGKCIDVKSGLCGHIYIFDQGENVYPRYSCVKLPKPQKGCAREEVNYRFLSEMENQMSYSHRFVHWPCDFNVVKGAPSAVFRYWGSDLRCFIKESCLDKASKLSVMIYICSGMMHCHRVGLSAHQDLKPENIFIQNVKKDFVGLPDVNVYNFPLIADFGLADAFIRSKVFSGSRPYMAPEQWNKDSLSPKTDIFSLGVIFHEIFSDGVHPVGIITNDYWPSPKEGYTKKWVRDKDWRKWANKQEKVLSGSDAMSIEEKEIISSMLSFYPEDRPNLSEVQSRLLLLMKDGYREEYDQVNMLVKYFDDKSSEKGVKENWPALWEKWSVFKKNLT